MYIYIYTYISIHTYMYIYIYIDIHMYIYIYIHLNIHICMYILHVQEPVQTNLKRQAPLSRKFLQPFHWLRSVCMDISVYQLEILCNSTYMGYWMVNTHRMS